MLKRVLDHIRDHLEKPLQPPKRIPAFSVLKLDTWSERFENLMRNRLIMGSIRYETWEEKRKNKDTYDYPTYIREKLAFYEETGNIEELVDIANAAMLEFEFGQHPRKHFAAIDDHKIHAQKRKNS